MSPWLAVLLVAALALAGLAWLYHLLDRRERHVDDVINDALDDLDSRPEFAVSPADWPYRESPGRAR